MEQRGNLTLIREDVGRTPDGHILGEWACDCGATTTVINSRVRNGYTKSCGCLLSGNEHGKTHGMRGTPAYKTWTSMKQRCLNPRNKDYPRWGGRGVLVCPEWSHSFDAFYRDMGDRPVGTTLDRIDPRGNYSPDNCRWATPKQQARNRSDLVTVNTKWGKMALVDYAKKLGISKGAAHLRLKRGKLEGLVDA